MKYFLTVNIEKMGAALNNGEKSDAGHMWYSLTSSDDTYGVEITKNYGFAPDENHQGNPVAPGKVYGGIGDGSN